VPLLEQSRGCKINKRESSTTLLEINSIDPQAENQKVLRTPFMISYCDMSRLPKRFILYSDP
jgi:hypothetical protein